MPHSPATLVGIGRHNVEVGAIPLSSERLAIGGSLFVVVIANPLQIHGLDDHNNTEGSMKARW